MARRILTHRISQRAARVRALQRFSAAQLAAAGFNKADSVPTRKDGSISVRDFTAFFKIVNRSVAEILSSENM